jgi:hypothetical protein
MIIPENSLEVFFHKFFSGTDVKMYSPEVFLKLLVELNKINGDEENERRKNEFKAK